MKIFGAVKKLFSCTQTDLTLGYKKVGARSCLLCLNIGNLSLADCTEIDAGSGADETILPSVSVTRSKELPGALVPGFQNCIIKASYGYFDGPETRLKSEVL